MESVCLCFMSFCILKVSSFILLWRLTFKLQQVASGQVLLGLLLCHISGVCSHGLLPEHNVEKIIQSVEK